MLKTLIKPVENGEFGDAISGKFHILAPSGN
jgi:hypothetical protein